LATGAADAGAGLRRLDIIVVMVEARGGFVDWRCDSEWAGADFARGPMHGLLVSHLAVVIMRIVPSLSSRPVRLM